MAAAVARFHQDDLIAFSPGPPGADDHITSSPTRSDCDLIYFSPASRLPPGGGPAPAPKKWQNQVSNSASPGHGLTLFALPAAARSESSASGYISPCERLRLKRQLLRTLEPCCLGQPELGHKSRALKARLERSRGFFSDMELDSRLLFDSSSKANLE
ncbi:MAG: hypothetical protein LQ349_007693 [Xanthoria aureola]|nr:MAG: hypothetical protein LQ349_007693 [Xanthoria aureola]